MTVERLRIYLHGPITPAERADARRRYGQDANWPSVPLQTSLRPAAATSTIDRLSRIFARRGTRVGRARCQPHVAES